MVISKENQKVQMRISLTPQCLVFALAKKGPEEICLVSPFLCF